MKLNKTVVANRLANGLFGLVGSAIKAVVITATITATILITDSFVRHQLKSVRDVYGWRSLFVNQPAQGATK